MKNELISFETAKLAKEKGFNNEVDKGWYYDSKDSNLISWLDLESYLDQKDFLYQATTQALLQRWLREVKGIHIVVDYYGKSEYLIEVLNYKGNNMIGESLKGIYFETYEEALEKGLVEVLKLI